MYNIVWAVLLGRVSAEVKFVDYNSDWGLSSPVCSHGLEQSPIDLPGSRLIYTSTIKAK